MPVARLLGERQLLALATAVPHTQQPQEAVYKFNLAQTDTEVLGKLSSPFSVDIMKVPSLQV